MGKRSSGFERSPNDFYPTPAKAVLPLIPHLRRARVKTFAEPCCGDGDLVRYLEAAGLRCTYAGDIATGRDALALQDYGDPDAIITNPPYSDKPKPPYTRELMHRLIQHFLGLAPAWLLLELDSAATKRMQPQLRHCSDIVPIGRLKLIPETKGGGMQNFAWYRFDARHCVGPVFHPFRSAALLSPAARACMQCSAPYRPQRSDSRFCSDTCRQRAHRERLAVTQA